jgi:membrane protein involved in colicin uptake
MLGGTKKPPMKQRVSRCIGLLLLPLSVCAQPILIAPQNQSFAGSSLSNLRVLRQSADGTEAILTLDFIYNGINGPTARLLPVISDKKQPKVSSWFGANPVTISAGHGTISLKVKFFNDDPGVPPELTTDHVRVMMLSDGGNSVISQGIFSRTIKWGSPNAAITVTPPPEPQPTDEARLKAEQEQRIGQERAKAEAEAKAREEARLKAQAEEKARQEAVTRQLAEEKAKADAEAKAREEARLKAEAEVQARQEAEAQRLAKEKSKAEAEAKIEADAKAREEARLKAADEEKARQEAVARQLAEVKAKADAEAKVREEARLKAEAETQARQEAEAQRIAEEKSKAEADAKIQADAKAREEARLKAADEEKARQDAVARQLAEVKAKADAEAKAREEARLKAEAEAQARQEAEAQRLAEEKSKAEAEAKIEADAKAREEARLKAADEEKARQDAVARQLAEEKAKADAEAKAREEARLKADAEAQARQEAEAQRVAEEKSKAEAEAKTREEEAKRLAEEQAGAATPAQTALARKSAFVISSKTKTKVTNVDVVNRNLDRTEMTIAVEYQYAKADGPARMGVDVASTDDPGVADYFSCPPMDIGKGSRNFVMFPVQLNVAAAQSVKRPTLPTDKVWIYVADASGQKSYIFQGTMMLVWHIPGGAQPGAPTAAQSGGNTLEIESFKQNDLFSGYVTVKYNIRASEGRLRLRIFDSANPTTASWFASDDIAIKSGPGLELVRIAVPKGAASPDVFSADTVEIQMLNAKGAVLTALRKQSPMSWAKPK